MNRYHIKIGFEAQDINRLKTLTEHLNFLNWKHSEHFLDNLKYRVIDLENILRYIKGIVLDFTEIFEYYSENNIIKVCYRIPYTDDLDIILVLTPDKKIITIYLNSTDDKHFTLKKELYTRPRLNLAPSKTAEARF